MWLNIFIQTSIDKSLFFICSTGSYNWDVFLSLHPKSTQTLAPGLKKNGKNIGAVGISGDRSDEDEICAIAGIEAAGLEYCHNTIK